MIFLTVGFQPERKINRRVPWIEISITKRFAQNKKAREKPRAYERTPAIAVCDLIL